MAVLKYFKEVLYFKKSEKYTETVVPYSFVAYEPVLEII